MGYDAQKKEAKVFAWLGGSKQVAKPCSEILGEGSHERAENCSTWTWGSGGSKKKIKTKSVTGWNTEPRSKTA